MYVVSHYPTAFLTLTFSQLKTSDQRRFYFKLEKKNRIPLCLKIVENIWNDT